MLEHLWFLSEAAGFDVGLGEAVTSYVRDVLTPAPDEQRSDDEPWADGADDELDDDLADEFDDGHDDVVDDDLDQ